MWVHDVAGRRYLDCLAAYSAVNQGHCHPRILAAAIDQMHRVTLTSRAFRNDQLPLLYQQLNRLTGYGMAILMNSGTEAVETAIKAARKWGYILCKETHGTVIRLAPPLVITREEIDWALERLTRVLGTSA